MAWIKTIDGDFVNLDSGVSVEMENWPIDPDVRIYTNKKEILTCSGTYEECQDYMRAFEQGLIDAGETIIEIS